LLGRHFTTWAMPLALFALVILDIGVCFGPRVAWTTFHLFYASSCSWMIGTHHHTAFSCWDRVLQTFLTQLA
jgi:hypothetical protein